jgi:hypothetical protein
MNVLRFARVAKIAALICFVLPWITVSCSSGQRLGTLSGLDMSIGHMVVHNPVTGATQTSTVAPNSIVILAAAAIVVGLVLSFAASANAALRQMVITSVAAMAFAALGAEGTISTIESKIRTPDSSGLSGVAASMFKISLSTGFYLVLGSLSAAIILCLLGFQSRPIRKRGVPLTPDNTTQPRNANAEDVVFWDSMSSKSDPDLLEEYLARFPNGNFAALARKRLGLPASAASVEAKSTQIFTAKTVGATSTPRRPLIRYGLGAGVLIAVIVGTLIYFHKASVSSRSAPDLQLAPDAAVSASAASADAANTTPDATTVQPAPAPAMDAASQAAATPAAQSADDAVAAAADAQASADKARAAADAANQQSSTSASSISYSCAFASDLSREPIENATDMTFTIDEQRSCINGRSPYLREANGVLTKLMLNDQEHRASMLQISADRTVFLRLDAVMNPESYMRLRNQSGGLLSVKCSAPGDLLAANRVQQALASLAPRTAIQPATVVERHLTRWRCTPQQRALF